MFSFHRPDRAKDVLMILAWWWWMIMWGQLAPRLPEQKACCLPTQLLQPFSSSLPFSKIWNIVTTQKLFSRIVLCLKTPFGEVEQKVWKLAVEDGALHIPPIRISYSSTYIHIYPFSPPRKTSPASVFVSEMCFSSPDQPAISAMPLCIITHTQND